MAGKSVIFLLCSLFCGILAKDRVPVLIWNPSQVQRNLPAVPALHSIDYATFQSKYLADFKPKNIILFIQDALSVEDLSSHGAEFQALNQWMTNSHALYLPNVEEPAYLAHDLASHGYNVVSLEPGIPAAGLDLKQQDNNLVVVKLPSTLTNPSRSHALQKAVEVMQNVISKIGAKREFTFIFTGQKPSVEDNSKKYEGRVRVPRAANMYQDPGTGPQFHVENCVKLYVRHNFTFTIHENTTSGVNVETYDLNTLRSFDTGHCDTEGPERDARITLKYVDGVAPYGKVLVTLNYKAVRSSWEFTYIEVLLDTSTDNHNLDLASAAISGIPVGMSYSCAETTYLVSNDSTPGKKMEITMEGVQMEAFFDFSTANNATFSQAWDCVGFFTVPIWVSLLTTLLLVIILSIGLYMLSDIKTMDRFDDPKGQPIMVYTAAE